MCLYKQIFCLFSLGKIIISYKKESQMKSPLLRKTQFIEMREIFEQTAVDPKKLNIHQYVNLHHQKGVQLNPNAIQFLGDNSFIIHANNFNILRSIVKFYNRFPILSPQAIGVRIWSILNLFIINFYIIEIGFLIGFGQSFWQDQIKYFYYGNIFFLIFFLADLLISPLKSYHQNGILFDNRVTIFKRYIRFGFWIDIMGLIGILVPIISLNSITNFLKLLFVAKLYNAYQIDQYLMMVVKNTFKRSHWYSITRIVYIALLWSHYLGIGFFAVSYQVFKNNSYGPNTPNNCWIYNSSIDIQIAYNHWIIQYFYSIYYAVGNITTIAYGDIVPLNPTECLFIIFSMIFSVLLFTYLFKQIIEIIFFAKADQFTHQNSLNHIGTFLHSNKVSSNLSAKIKSFFVVSWQQQKFRNRQTELQQIEALPQNLKQDLYIGLFGNLVMDLGLLSQSNLQKPQSKTKFIYHLLSTIEFQIITSGQVLYREGQAFQENQYLYYVDDHNKLSITLGQKPLHEDRLIFDSNKKIDEKLLNSVFKGCFTIAYLNGLFGEVSFFTGRARDHWAVTNQVVEILKIKKSTFDRCKEQFGKDSQREKVFMIKEGIQFRECYICKEKGHSFKTCKLVTYQPESNILLSKMAEINSRMNNTKVGKVRQENQCESFKNHAWKSYKSLQNHIEQFRLPEESSFNNAPQDFTSLIQELIDFSRIIKKQQKDHDLEVHAQHWKLEQDEIDVDQTYNSCIYKVQGNLVNVVAAYHASKKHFRSFRHVKFFKKQSYINIGKDYL